MSASPVNYRHEYVSGVVIVATYPVAAFVHVLNRGDTEEHVRARCLRGSGELVFDSQDGLAYPERAWEFDSEPERRGPFFDSYWIQILTTSANLVPSACFRGVIAGYRNVPQPSSGSNEILEAEEDVNVMFAYFAPGDFAVFSLPSRPVHPIPPGPAEGA
jgi:hypothetical protein